MSLVLVGAERSTRSAAGKNKMKWELLVNSLATLIMGGLLFLVNRYFAQYMGGENLGLLQLFVQLSALLNLWERGLGTGASYLLYSSLNRGDREKTEKIIRTMRDFYRKISLGILGTGVLVGFSLPYIIGRENFYPGIYLYWGVYTLAIGSGYSFMEYQIFLTADRKISRVRIIQSLGKILCNLLQIGILIRYRSFLGFLLLILGENLVQYLLYRRELKKSYGEWNLEKGEGKPEQIPSQEKVELEVSMRDLLWHKVGEVIIHKTDYILITKFLSLAVVASYSSYLLITGTVITLLGIVTHVMTPRIGRYLAENREEGFHLWRKLNIISVFAGTLISYSVYIFADPFIKVWMGEGYLLPRWSVMLICINLYLYITRMVTEIFKNSYGYFSDRSLPIWEGAINLGISLLLVRKIGLSGVIIGTVVSNLVVIHGARPVILFRECFGRRGREYVKYAALYLLLSGSTVGLMLFL